VGVMNASLLLPLLQLTRCWSLLDDDLLNLAAYLLSTLFNLFTEEMRTKSLLKELLCRLLLLLPPASMFVPLYSAVLLSDGRSPSSGRLARLELSLDRLLCPYAFMMVTYLPVGTAS